MAVRPSRIQTQVGMSDFYQPIQPLDARAPAVAARCTGYETGLIIIETNGLVSEAGGCLNASGIVFHGDS